LPVKQYRSFTSGATTGQELLPISGGNPTVSGGASAQGLKLRLPDATGMRLTARLLPGNAATVIVVIVLDADGTNLRFTFPLSAFNTSTFASSTISFSAAATSAAGSKAGFDFAKFSAYMVQGNAWEPGGLANAAMAVQLDDLSVVG
jgi:hypothetical protein